MLAERYPRAELGRAVSRVTSSTTFSTLKRRPQANWSCTKSSDQRTLARASIRIGALVPVALLRCAFTDG
jgi:hypothetical protein